MTFADVMEELPNLTFEERQAVVRRAVELDDPGLSSDEEALVDLRLAGHHQNPDSSVPLDQMKILLRNQKLR